MNRDKYKNKSKARFLPEKEKHGKKEIRHSRKEKSKVRAVLAKLDPDEVDNLERSEKMI